MQTTSAIVIPNSDFSKRRTSLPTLPVNNIPPLLEKAHLWIPLKYDFDAGVITDPFGDAATDMKLVATYGKPSVVAASTVLGGRRSMAWAVQPTPRQILKSSLNVATNKFSLHVAYATDILTSTQKNRCVLALVKKDLTGVVRLQAYSGGNVATLIHSTGVVNPLGSNALTPFGGGDLTGAVAANTKYVMSLTYDGSVDGGKVIVSKNGVVTNTFTNFGALTLEGDLYLGADPTSGTSSSDMKGEIGIVAAYEYANTQEEVASIAAYLSAAF